LIRRYCAVEIGCSLDMKSIYLIRLMAVELYQLLLSVCFLPLDYDGKYCGLLPNDMGCFKCYQDCWYLHSKNIIHGNLKSEYIFFMSTGQQVTFKLNDADQRKYLPSMWMARWDLGEGRVSFEAEASSEKNLGAGWWRMVTVLSVLLFSRKGALSISRLMHAKNLQNIATWTYLSYHHRIRGRCNSN